MKIKTLFFIFIMTTSIAYGQDNEAFRYNKTDIVLYNVGIGAIFGGIGALVNKKESEDWHKVLFKGISQGALGGYVVYESKNLLRQINRQQDLTYALYAKGVNSIGVSMIENASMNRNFWEVWHINFGFNRFELHTKENFRFQYKFMPVSFLINSYLFTQLDFRLRETLQTGEFVFRGNTIDEFGSNGSLFGNAIIYDSSLQDSSIFPTLINHELVHLYQYNDFNPINSIFNQPIQELNSNSSFLKKVNPYVYYDFQHFFYLSVYNLEINNANAYHNNFFEFEAYYFSDDLERFR